MTSKQTIRCIYCGDYKPASDEHVLQRSMGGNLKPPIGCIECNRNLSKIDQALAERSLVAFTRLGASKNVNFDVQLGGEQFFFNEEHGIWQDVLLINGFQVHPYAQLHRYEDGFKFFSANSDEKEKFIALVDKLNSQGEIPRIYFKEGPADRCNTAHLVHYRKSEMYIRASSREEANAFSEWIGTKWSKIRLNLLSVRTDPKPVKSTLVWCNMSFDINDIYRAVAKISYGVLAVHKGIDFVLRSEFDEIRDYIIGKCIVYPNPLPDGALAVDTRFVREMPPGHTAGAPTSSHLLQFAYLGGCIVSFVTLYSRHCFAVQMAKIDLPPYGGLHIFGHEFSIDRSHNQKIGIEELAVRISKKRNNRREAS